MKPEGTIVTTCIITACIIYTFIFYLASGALETLFPKHKPPHQTSRYVPLALEAPPRASREPTACRRLQQPVYKWWDLPCCMEQRGPTHRPSTHLILHTRFSSKGPTTPMNMTSCRSRQREKQESDSFIECGIDLIKFWLRLIFHDLELERCLEWWTDDVLGSWGRGLSMVMK